MNITTYFQRINWSGPAIADLETLQKIHLHHATHIPFENLDIQLGKNISLELESLERKMVQNNRGGYCFEQNTLFQAVLTEIGFNVIACEARVRMGRSIVTPRTHMLLIVTLKDGRYLADVGFGGDGLLLPVSMDGNEHDQFLWKYRIVEEGPMMVLQIFRAERWMDLYAFVPQGREPVDFQVASWFTSTHPESRFVQTLTVQQPTPEARFILRNKMFVIDRGDQEETRELKTREELIQTLDRTFGLSFPINTPFRNPIWP
ncbi:arylamine N-acetyltransferase [bacterium]|nr:arylamine N-acetyltransferase [bacterium]MCI0604393.1 arylamine N-acetyltransferase [bacterium]